MHRNAMLEIQEASDTSFFEVVIKLDIFFWVDNVYEKVV